MECDTRAKDRTGEWCNFVDLSINLSTTRARDVRLKDQNRQSILIHRLVASCGPHREIASAIRLWTEKQVKKTRGGRNKRQGLCRYGYHARNSKIYKNTRDINRDFAMKSRRKCNVAAKWRLTPPLWSPEC